MLLHNLTISLRNLWKYKLQTAISIISIAIGIVILAFVHSLLQRFGQPAICSQPHYDRACVVEFAPVHGTDKDKGVELNGEILRALKGDGGMRCVENLVVTPNEIQAAMSVEFRLADSRSRKFSGNGKPVDSGYVSYAGFRSAVTGETLRPLKPGEMVLDKRQARQIFDDANPIGLTCTLHHFGGDREMRVADVYEPVSMFETEGQAAIALYCLGEWERQADWMFASAHANVVLREGATLQQLEREANERLKPMGLKVKATWVKDWMHEDMVSAMLCQFFGHLFALLILLAGAIGYLRMQIQLFWMRRREVALRIVNGAKRGQLFTLLMTEVGLVLGAAMLCALVLSAWVANFCATRFAAIGQLDALFAASVGSTARYCILVFCALLAVCGLIVWLTLRRICKTNHSIAENMRGSRSHAFRNVMLCVQLIVSMFFVFVSVLAMQWVHSSLQRFVVPDDETRYKESIYILNVLEAEAPVDNLYRALAALPDVACSFAFDVRQHRLADKFVTVQLVNDTVALDFLDMDIKWLRRDADRTRCLLVRDETYSWLEEQGLLDNGVLDLGIYGVPPLPVAGIFVGGIAYDNKAGMTAFVAVCAEWGEDWRHRADYVLVPKTGQSSELRKQVEATVQRMEPSCASPMIFNYYERQAVLLLFVRVVRVLSIVFGLVCITICIMGIYSTIALDTRVRRKEVAIRKINGARRWDIARLFARLYVVLIALALPVVVPAAYLCARSFGQLGVLFVINSPLLSIAAACLSVIFTIALIVGWQVRGIMRVNPADIIAKE